MKILHRSWRNAFLMSVLLIMAACSHSVETVEKPRKNVTVIIADDHALKVTGCYGNTPRCCKMPQIIDIGREAGLVLRASRYWG